MQSLRVRYLGPTNTRGSRFKVIDSYGVEEPATFSYDYASGAPKIAACVEYLSAKMPNMGYRAADAKFAGFVGNDTLYIFH